MQIANVGVPQGVNAQKVTAFVGSMLHEMNVLGLSHEFQTQFIKENKELTSPFPFVGELSNAISHAAHVVGNEINGALQRATQNSGPQNAR